MPRLREWPPEQAGLQQTAPVPGAQGGWQPLGAGAGACSPTPTVTSSLAGHLQ